jgi:hypothetical protein
MYGEPDILAQVHIGHVADRFREHGEKVETPSILLVAPGVWPPVVGILWNLAA